MSENRFVSAYRNAESTRDVHEQTGLGAGSLRMYAYQASIPWPGELAPEPFWTEVDERVLQGKTIEHIAKSTSSKRQHIEQYLDESGQREQHRSFVQHRRALQEELAALLQTYHSDITPALAQNIVARSQFSLKQALTLAEHANKPPGQLAKLVGAQPACVSRVMTRCGVRHRSFTSRPKARTRMYDRAQHTVFSYEDVAELLAVTTQAVRGYASNKGFRLEKSRRIPWSVRMQALSVPEFTPDELSEALDISVSDAQKAQDQSYTPKIIHQLRLLFDDSTINTPFVTRSYVQEKLSE